MKIYLAENVIEYNDRYTREPVGIFSSKRKAQKEIKSGIVTEIEIDEVYKEGIGICEHWHINQD